ncbi:MAG TPA: STAS domain-containing protein [Candidatus Baltobacteraceae bacterium]|nr:STAS domain-containing protein [Candidatus Baltobacteraceae bacterium]
MSERVPILKVGQVLIVSIAFDLSDETTLALQQDLSARIVETSARGVIIDISGLEIVDSFIGRMLSTIASMSSVLDAETVVVGMRPAVAITLTELGLSLGGVRTALNAEKGFELLRELSVFADFGTGEDAAWQASVDGAGHVPR